MFYVNSRENQTGWRWSRWQKKYLDEFGYEQKSSPGIPDTAPRPTDFKNIVELIAEYTGLQRSWIGTNLYNFKSFTIPTKSFVTQDASGGMVLIVGKAVQEPLQRKVLRCQRCGYNPAVRISLQRTILASTAGSALRQNWHSQQIPSTIGGVTFRPGLYFAGINSGAHYWTVDVLGKLTPNLLLYRTRCRLCFRLKVSPHSFWRMDNLGSETNTISWGFNA